MYDLRIETLRSELEALPFRSVTEAKAFILDLRKAVEPSKSTRKTIWFFCSWALHAESQKGMPATFRELTDLFDIKDGMTQEQYLETNYLTKAMVLQPFRDALSAFLKDKGLPETLTYEVGHWLNFIDLFMDIVQNVPIDLSRDATRTPDDVKEMRVLRWKDQDYLPTSTVWQVTRWDGRQYQATHLYNTSFRER